jgi:16S rRNA (guanine527-N7)-methyltransferase
MRILVVGSGGREHALCWAIAASPLTTKLFCAPGNAGIAEEAECVAIAADDIERLVAPAGDGGAGQGPGDGSEDVSSAALESFFGTTLPLARRFVEHLTTTAVERGLVGPREVPRIWSRHVLNCASVAELIPRGVDVGDVGSGAGLPGLVLAIARPDLAVWLIEPLLRRTTWLTEVVTDLGLDNVRVLRARAEDLRGHLLVDIATARAVASLPTLWSWSGPLLRPGGALLAIKGSRAAAEVEGATVELKRQGAASWRVDRCGVGLLDPPTTVVVVNRESDARASAGARRGARRGQESR